MGEKVKKASEMASYFPKEAAITGSALDEGYCTAPALMSVAHALAFPEKEETE